MMRGGSIEGMRRYRFAIGTIAAALLLLSQLLTVAAATADPLQAYLDGHLCGPSAGEPGSTAPALPGDHQNKCQLCGPACAMGGHSLSAPLSGGVAWIAPLLAVVDLSVAPLRAPRPTPALYPSDISAQGPPSAT